MKYDTGMGRDLAGGLDAQIAPLPSEVCLQPSKQKTKYYRLLSDLLKNFPSRSVFCFLGFFFFHLSVIVLLLVCCTPGIRHFRMSGDLSLCVYGWRGGRAVCGSTISGYCNIFNLGSG